MWDLVSAAGEFATTPSFAGENADNADVDPQRTVAVPLPNFCANPSVRYRKVYEGEDNQR